MPASPVADARDYSFHCDCGEDMRHACEGEPFYKEHEGKKYCVLHFPGEKDSSTFKRALRWKTDIRDFNFQGIWFAEEVSFKSRFFAERVDFRKAHFSKKADFTEATFGDKADFRFATFGAGVNFGYATFKSTADFRVTNFGSQAAFSYAIFHADTDFSFATFSGSVTFVRATFEGYAKFAGSDSRNGFSDAARLNLGFSNIEKPDRVSFYSLSLRPHWFVNVDARKFEFINVNWNRQNVKQEVKGLGRDDNLSAHRLLAIACRNLAVNAEENHRYDEASRFRYMAMESRRLESRQGWRGIVSWVLGWLYWLASGYSERAGRAFVVLIGIWLLAATLYTQVGFVRWEPRVSSEQEAWEARRDEVGQPLRWQRALTYSLGVMTLQRPEPRPATDAAQALVMFETILGPVQAALLALAIRRKFMR